jgi:dTDP-4-amino-4,6-dideoxygalactose transaminase
MYSVNPRLSSAEFLQTVIALSQQGDPTKDFLDMISPSFPGARILTFNYGRAALGHLFRSLDLRGKKVVFPAYSCRSFGRLCLAEGIEPMFIDADPATFNIDTEQLESTLNGDVAAVVAIHTFGNPCNLDALLELREEHGFLLVEDCAHALGARYKDRPVGTSGDVALFSMYKTLPNIAGAFLVVNNPELAIEQPGSRTGMSILDSALLFNLLEASESRGVKGAKRGIARMLRQRGVTSPAIDDEHVEVADCPTGAMALFTRFLDQVLEEAQHRVEIGQSFLEGIEGIPQVTPQHILEGMSWMNVPVLIEDPSERDHILETMLHQGIVCDRIWWDSVISEPAIQKDFDILPNDFPAATTISRSILNLPIRRDYTPIDVEHILSTLNGALGGCR